MTTDTVSKEVAVSLTLGGKTVTIGEMCKGFAYPPQYVYDVGICDYGRSYFQAITSESVEPGGGRYLQYGLRGRRYLGNDTVLLLANGMAGNPEITEEKEEYQEFLKALLYVNTCLAQEENRRGRGRSQRFV